MTQPQPALPARSTSRTSSKTASIPGVLDLQGTLLTTSALSIAHLHTWPRKERRTDSRIGDCALWARAKENLLNRVVKITASGEMSNGLGRSPESADSRRKRVFGQ